MTFFVMLFYFGGCEVAWDHARAMKYNRYQSAWYAFAWPWQLGQCVASFALRGRWERLDP